MTNEITNLKSVVNSLNAQSASSQPAVSNDLEEFESKANDAIKRVDALQTENNRIKSDLRCLKYEVKKLKNGIDQDA